MCVCVCLPACLHMYARVHGPHASGCFWVGKITSATSMLLPSKLVCFLSSASYHSNANHCLGWCTRARRHSSSTLVCVCSSTRLHQISFIIDTALEMISTLIKRYLRAHALMADNYPASAHTHTPPSRTNPQKSAAYFISNLQTYRDTAQN